MFSFFADKLNVKNLGEYMAPTLSIEHQLHQAIEDGLLDKMNHLIHEEKVDPKARNASGNLPLHTAAYYGQQACLDALLTHGMDINVLGARNNTPLHYAASQGHFDLVQHLVALEANAALRNAQGKTPYDLATRDNIRQFLLPLQFRHEDPSQIRLPPGITPSQAPTSNPIPMAPPPTMGVVYAPSNAPKRTDGVFRPIQADGFGSSVGNAALTAKYGNTVHVKQTAPPPVLAPGSMPSYSAGVNPYAQGRYTAYDVQTNSATALPIQPTAPPKAPPAIAVFDPRAHEEEEGEAIDMSASTKALQ